MLHLPVIQPEPAPATPVVVPPCCAAEAHRSSDAMRLAVCGPVAVVLLLVATLPSARRNAAGKISGATVASTLTA